MGKLSRTAGHVVTALIYASTLAFADPTAGPQPLPPNVLVEAPNIQPASYSPNYRDCSGLPIIASGAFQTITLPSSGDLPTGCRIKIVNANTGRAQALVGAVGGVLPTSLPHGCGGTCLWPGQAIEFFNSGPLGWRVSQNPGRWQPQIPPMFYVCADTCAGAAGSDNNDGLANTAPLQHIQTGVLIVEGQIDFGGSNYRIATLQLMCNTDATPETFIESLHIFYSLVGTNNFTIRGNIADPDSCILRPSADDHAIFVKDGAIATVQGLKIANVPSGFSALMASWGSTIDFGWIDFGPSSGASHLNAQEGGIINEIGPYTISGSASTHAYAAFGGMINFDATPVTVSAPVRFSNFLSASAAGNINYGLTVTYNNPGNIAAPQCSVIMNGTINKNNTTIPGSPNTCSAVTGGQVQ